MIIRDPGTGRGVGVTNGDMLLTKNVSQLIPSHVNMYEEESYSAVIAVTPTGAGDCFFYITNNKDLEMVVSSLKLQSAAAENVQVKLGDTGTVGGTHAALLPINRNAGSVKTAEVTCESGVDITGLAGGSVVDELVSGTTMWRWIWDSDLIIPKNRTLSLYAVTGAIAIKGTLGFYFKCECMDP